MKQDKDDDDLDYTYYYFIKIWQWNWNIVCTTSRASFVCINFVSNIFWVFFNFLCVIVNKFIVFVKTIKI